MRRRPLALLLATLLVGAACGEEQRDDAAIAREGLLTADDLPGDWKRSQGSDSDEQVVGCVQKVGNEEVRDLAAKQTAREKATFTRRDETAAVGVTVYGNDETPKTFLDTLLTQELVDCLTEAATKEITDASELSISVIRIKDVGDARVGLRFELTVPGGDAEIRVLYVRDDRTLGELFLSNSTGGVDDELAESLLVDLANNIS